ncbi:metalloregulator ArsR/SmtB family transcription factor [Pelagibius sp. Alg239-R121]|uniref:helix-turn-helix transcriptional regulator n=1 Tax=Pelagibius sp. Alg239-R121 TaxID=2993448 RepID=UPI0024A68E95|nr:ArsR family transcriptional regulator [Pelagibius sp. Alg239-R121]
MSTKDDILSLLRRESLTVTELSARLDVTRNAVIVPLRQLEADGLIQGAERRDKRVGKPALEYTAVAGREDVASRAYPPFAELLLQTLPEHLSRDQISRLMQQVGRKMATHLDADAEAGFSERLKAATDFADSVGAETVVEETGDGAVVRSYSCPLGRAVRQEACVCSVIAAFFAEVTDAEVDEQCDRGEKLFCKFVITE